MQFFILFIFLFRFYWNGRNKITIYFFKNFLIKIFSEKKSRGGEGEGEEKESGGSGTRNSAGNDRDAPRQLPPAHFILVLRLKRKKKTQRRDIIIFFDPVSPSCPLDSQFDRSRDQSPMGTVGLLINAHLSFRNTLAVGSTRVVQADAHAQMS